MKRRVVRAHGDTVMAPTSAAALFNAWMAGHLEYDELSPEAQALADEYLEDYWANIDALCEVGH